MEWTSGVCGVLSRRDERERERLRKGQRQRQRETGTFEVRGT